MQRDHDGRRPPVRLAVLQEVQTQQGICTKDGSQSDDVEDTTRESARHQHQRDGDANVHEKIC